MGFFALQVFRGQGGALYLSLPSTQGSSATTGDAAVLAASATWRNCSFNSNQAAAGGAVQVLGAPEGAQGLGLALDKSTFISNSATEQVGVMVQAHVVNRFHRYLAGEEKEMKLLSM
jgi:hypothetical protein